ncbi:MAG TPA: DNA-3-methyladenine glycosylase [Acidimicrobiales bacterium]|nr:DNA-3-methyladenine glycosylase [Acidimicrobiales bacterium]
MRPLGREFYRRDSRAVAPDLLGKVVVAGERRGRIVEVEAYCGPEDPAAHSYRGPTARNATMFGAPGHLYVYFTYGMHWCCNPVCGDDDEGVAVLLRALEPLAGLEAMRAARGGVRDRDLCRGPARLCEALGITGTLDGADLVTGDRGVSIVDDGTPPPADPAVGPRIGVTRGADSPWRWWVPDSPWVSRSPGRVRTQ